LLLLAEELSGIGPLGFVVGLGGFEMLALLREEGNSRGFAVGVGGVPATAFPEPVAVVVAARLSASLPWLFLALSGH